MIKQAKLAGASIAKFQFGWRNTPEEINFIDQKRAELLKQWCDYWEIEMMASIITEEAFELARHINLNRYKIASRTVVDNPDLCHRILSEDKETFVSLGMWQGLDFPFGKPDKKKIRYIFCRSKYPTYPNDLVDFPDAFHPKEFYGYSDHMHGIEACLLAIARGALFIEKHFTLNKTSQVIRDHILSASPFEFKQLTELGNSLSKLVVTVKKYQ